LRSNAGSLKRLRTQGIKSALRIEVVETLFVENRQVIVSHGGGNVGISGRVGYYSRDRSSGDNAVLLEKPGCHHSFAIRHGVLVRRWVNGDNDRQPIAKASQCGKS
jgi:ribosomal protein S4E